MTRILDPRTIAEFDGMMHPGAQDELLGEANHSDSVEVFASRLASILLEQCLAKRQSTDEP